MRPLEWMTIGKALGNNADSIQSLRQSWRFCSNDLRARGDKKDEVERIQAKGKRFERKINNVATPDGMLTLENRFFDGPFI